MDFGSLLHIVKVGFVLIFMISVLVAAHEYGHYLFARMFKMGVEEFAIGFGRRPLWVWMRKTYQVESIPSPAGGPAPEMTYPTDGSNALQPEPEPTPSNLKQVVTETTDFTVRPWPLGGFVRIKGMVPEDDGSETKIPGGFYSKAPWKRFLVLLAGPLFSVLAGVIILTGLYSYAGVDKPVNEPILDVVVKGGPADKAGLKADDRVLSLDGQKVATFTELTKYVREHPGQKIAVEYKRGDKTLTTTVTPIKGPVYVFDEEMNPTGKSEGGKLNVTYKTYHTPVSIGEAFGLAIDNPVRTIKGLFGLFRKPSEFKDSVGGPGTIAKVTSEATKQGVGPVIELMAMLSISVGIFNLLPVPPLDGGQMLVAIAEMLRGGRRLSMKVQGAVTAIGLALVAMLFISVVFIDIGRLSQGEKSADKVITKDEKK